MTREQFDEHNEELWEATKQWQDPRIMAAQLAYAELLNRRIFGPRPENGTDSADHSSPEAK
jgi:hypothetical protein